jgi:hypothetical protein
MNSDWITGDRTGVCYDKTPGNMREILHASESNYRLSRLPGLEWQDELADRIALALAQGAEINEALQASIIGYQANPLHLRWGCQDGIARYVLQQHKQVGLFDFGSAVEAPSNGVPLPPPPPTA